MESTSSRLFRASGRAYKLSAPRNFEPVPMRIDGKFLARNDRVLRQERECKMKAPPCDNSRCIINK